ncbi:MAG: hypothetical protein LBG79_09185 [Spirochaetaceae bacterium]|nr:hypothetical protein [Spirochaetaceae bacterium]
MRLCLKIIFIILPVLTLYSAPDLSYREEINRRIVQRIEWQKDEAALDYLIEIEQFKDGFWNLVFTETTAENFVEVSLLHGTYRYRLTPSDLLGRRPSVRPWASLIIHQIFQPELLRAEPEFFYLDTGEAEYELEIFGSNILNESVFKLRSNNGVEISAKRVIRAPDGNSAKLEFNRASLSEGLFEIIIENPGALSDSLRNFRISSRSEGDFVFIRRYYFMEGYAPLIALPGLFNDYFGTNFFPAGVSMHIGWTPWRIFKIQSGFEFQGGFHYLSAPVTNPGYSSYEISAQLIDLKLNLVCVIPVMRKFKISLRGGLGFVVLNDVKLREGDLVSPQRHAWILAAGAGASFGWYILPTFYIDAGAEYLYLFSVDNPPPQYIIPVLRIGFQF